jgi:hypothetical protein
VPIYEIFGLALIDKDSLGRSETNAMGKAGGSPGVREADWKDKSAAINSTVNSRFRIGINVPIN